MNEHLFQPHMAFTRWGIAAALLVGVYLETGWVTTLCLFLVFARGEMQDYAQWRPQWKP